MLENESIKKFIEEVGEGQANVLKVAEKLLSDGAKEVTCQLERRKQMPERMESRARAHVFHEAAGFIAYLKDNKTANCVVLADVASVRVAAVLNDNAENGYEVIVLEPKRHPEFSLLEDTLLDQEMDAKRFAKMVLRNRGVIAGDAKDAKQLALLMSQVTVSDQISLAMGEGKKAVNGIMCRTEIKAGTGETQVELPDEITFETPIYLETSVQRFDADITVVGNTREGVLVGVDAPQLVLCKYRCFEEIVKPIREMEGVLVSYGCPHFADWMYNR